MNAQWAGPVLRRIVGVPQAIAGTPGPEGLWEPSDLHAYTDGIEVEEACQKLYDHGIVAYPYTTEVPVEVLGAKYKWARAAGLL